jgi:uncharacterized protein
MISIIQQIKIKEILAPFEPIEIGIFGSYARSENTDSSDLDILVQFGKKLNLFDLVDLENKLSKALGIKVDLVTKNALNPFIKEFIEKDLRKIA